MKKILQTLLALVLSITAQAQVPQAIPYQAAARNANGNIMANQAINVRFTIHDSIANGTAVYQETHSTTTNAQGMFSLNMGLGTPTTGSFNQINWGNNAKFMQVELSTNGGTNYTDMGTQQMMSVPFAMYANSAGSVTGGGSGGNFIHYIGESFGGGVIFHLWKDNAGGEHGLVVDINDISNFQVWSNINNPNISNTSIGPSAQSSWDGLGNSNAIVGQAGHTSSAAALCLNSVNGGQSDWYLPAFDELSLLWHNRFNVNKSLSTIGGATAINFSYWSSTESTSSNVWYFYIDNGGNIGYGQTGKNSNLKVRAVRSF